MKPFPIHTLSILLFVKVICLFRRYSPNTFISRFISPYQYKCKCPMSLCLYRILNLVCRYRPATTIVKRKRGKITSGFTFDKDRPRTLHSHKISWLLFGDCFFNESADVIGILYTEPPAICSF